MNLVIEAGKALMTAFAFVLVGLMFLFFVSIIMIAIYIGVLCGRDLYEEVFKESILRLKAKWQKGKNGSGYL